MGKLTTIAAVVLGAAAAAVAGTLLRTGSAAAVAPLPGELLILSDNGMLTRHNAARPTSPTRWMPVTGLAEGERLIGLDIRPDNGKVYSLSTAGELYTVDPTTGRATRVGVSVALTGRAIGFDVDPTTNRIRVVTDTGQNFSVDPDTGTSVAGPTLAYPDTDPAAGSVPEVAAAGFTNNVPGARSTTLYGVDSSRETLVRIDPDTGALTTIGPIGVAVTESHGFDIKTTPTGDRAVAAVQPETGGGPVLVEFDLGTGKATVLATLPTRPVGLAFLG